MDSLIFAKASDPEDTCLSKALMDFVINGFCENDAVVKAVEFCAKAIDPEGMPSTMGRHWSTMGRPWVDHGRP